MDFRLSSPQLRCKIYPILHIQDILSRQSGYSFLTKMDISMQYYTFVLDKASKDLCTIATPFGLYRYNCLPMGISQYLDIAQGIMEQVLRSIHDLKVYINDIACFSSKFKTHLILIRTALAFALKDLSSLLKNVNGPSKKHTSLAIGSHLMDSNNIQRKSKLFSPCKRLKQ